MPAEAPETVRGKGQANDGGAPGLEYSLGIRGWGQNSEHSKNTIYDTAVTVICDIYRCTYSDVDIKCSLIISHSNCPKYILRCSLISINSLATSSPTPRLFVICVSHYFDANAIMNCLAEKGISLPPCAPVQQGRRPRCPRGSGAPDCRITVGEWNLIE